MSNWTIDTAHSEVAFSVRHMMFSKVRGTFGEWKSSFHYDPEDPSKSTVQAEIAAASIDTSNEDRDNHLRSDDFFSAETFPTIRFESTSVAPEGDDMRVEGNLTIRDTTHPVTLAVSRVGSGVDPWGNKRVGFHGTAKISRKAFGLTWNQALEAGGVLVGDEISIELTVQAMQAAG